jgi:hypothetical protein
MVAGRFALCDPLAPGRRRQAEISNPAVFGGWSGWRGGPTVCGRLVRREELAGGARMLAGLVPPDR